jgi:uncharacterized protein with FMN-binding domain
MRRHILALVTAAALASPTAGALAATHASQKATAKKKVVTKKYAGAVEQADRWGTVQVTVTVQTTTVAGSKKATRRYVDLGGSYTYHTGRSQFIMSNALPQLRSEFLSAQSPKVQMVSGASYTSQAFEESLQSALSKAGA